MRLAIGREKDTVGSMETPVGIYVFAAESVGKAAILRLNLGSGGAGILGERGSGQEQQNGSEKAEARLSARFGRGGEGLFVFRGQSQCHFVLHLYHG